MIQNSFRPIRPMILVFILLNALFITGRSWLERKGVNQEVLIYGNLILFVVMVISFLMTLKSLNSANPNVFVRAMYGSFIIKFFVFAIAAFAYIMIAKKQVNKPALFICMGFYLVYTFLEVTSLQKLLRNRKNAEERSSH